MNEDRSLLASFGKPRGGVMSTANTQRAVYIPKRRNVIQNKNDTSSNNKNNSNNNKFKQDRFHGA